MRGNERISHLPASDLHLMVEFINTSTGHEPFNPPQNSGTSYVFKRKYEERGERGGERGEGRTFRDTTSSIDPTTHYRRVEVTVSRTIYIMTVTYFFPISDSVKEEL